MIRMIAACSSNGVIGLNNSIPFHYPEDLKHFKQSTQNSVVIMGRKTFESLNNKCLPNRRNIIITSQNIDSLETYSSLQEAIKSIDVLGDIWLIGGAKIYEEGMKLAEEIILTITTDYINEDGVVKFPWINPLKFKVTETKKLGSHGLIIVTYQKLH